MANWAKGLAAGLETGYRMGEMYQKGAERRALQEAAQATPEQFQGYTAEQGAQLEAAAKSGLYDIGMKQDEAGNFAGYTVTPKAAPEMQGLVAPGQVSEMFGQRYAGALTPEQVTGLRMGRMADVVSETDPIRAQQMRAAQAEQEFQSKYRPMQLESAGLALSKGKREEAAAGRMEALQAWRSENPNASFMDVVNKTNALGMSLNEQKDAAAAILGLEKGALDSSEIALKRLVQGKSLDQLLDAHRTSDLLDPGSHFEKRIGAGGKVSLDRVDTATGKVIQPGVFSGTENEVLGYLNKKAVSPEALVDYTMNLEKSRLAMDKDRAAIAKEQALTGYYGTRGGLDKMGAAQYFTGADGNTYAAVPTMTKEGLKFDTVRVNPEGIKLAKPGTDGAGAKPVKTPEAGEKYTIQGKPMQADGMGGFISARGVLPDDRAKAMGNLGIPDNYIGRLQWSNDGESVLFGDTRYSMVGKEAKSDVKQLLKDIEAADVMNQRIREANRQRMNPPNVLTGLDGTVRNTGFGPALTYPGRS